MTKALTKTQKEFFNEFVKSTVVTIVGQFATEGYRESLPAVADVILTQSIAEGNLDHVVETTANELTSRVDFKTIRKVDAFMKSEDFLKVLQAMHDVLYDSLREDYMNLVAATAEVSEKAIKSLARDAEQDSKEPPVEESAI